MATDTPLPPSGAQSKGNCQKSPFITKIYARSGKQGSSSSPSMLVQYFQLKKMSLARYPQIQQVKAAKIWFTGTSEFFISPTCHCTRTEEVVWGVTNTELGGSSGTKQEKKETKAVTARRWRRGSLLSFIKFFFFTAEGNLPSQLLHGGSQKQLGGCGCWSPGRSQALLLHPFLSLCPWQLEQSEKSSGCEPGGSCSSQLLTQHQMPICKEVKPAVGCLQRVRKMLPDFPDFLSPLGQAHLDFRSLCHTLFQSGQLDLPQVNPFLCPWSVALPDTPQQLKHEVKAYQELTALHSAMLKWQHWGCSAE